MLTLSSRTSARRKSPVSKVPLQQEWFGWQSSLGIAIIDPRDRDTGHTLGRRARRTLSLDLDRQFDRLGVWRQLASGEQQLQ